MEGPGMQITLIMDVTCAGWKTERKGDQHVGPPFAVSIKQFDR